MTSNEMTETAEEICENARTLVEFLTESLAFDEIFYLLDLCTADLSTAEAAELLPFGEVFPADPDDAPGYLAPIIRDVLEWRAEHVWVDIEPGDLDAFLDEIGW